MTHDELMAEVEEVQRGRGISDREDAFADEIIRLRLWLTTIGNLPVHQIANLGTMTRAALDREP